MVVRNLTKSLGNFITLKQVFLGGIAVQRPRQGGAETGEMGPPLDGVDRFPGPRDLQHESKG